MSAKKISRTKAAAVNLRPDAVALSKLVTLTLDQIKIGQPKLMAVSIVNLRGLPLAAMMIKGPPPPPLKDLKAFFAFVTDGVQRIGIGQSLVMVATVADLKTNGFTALMARGPLPLPESAVLVRGAPPPPL